jgi:hypothetical protein
MRNTASPVRLVGNGRISMSSLAMSGVAAPIGA